MPKESADWFSKFINDRNDIDVWLSLRVLNNDLLANNNLTLSKYKYFTEFKVNDFEILKASKVELEKNKIKIKVLIDDVQRYIKEKIIRPTRTTQFQHKNYAVSLSKKVVGRYASFGDVNAL